MWLACACWFALAWPPEAQQVASPPPVKRASFYVPLLVISFITFAYLSHRARLYFERGAHSGSLPPPIVLQTSIYDVFIPNTIPYDDPRADDGYNQKFLSQIKAEHALYQPACRSVRLASTSRYEAAGMAGRSAMTQRSMSNPGRVSPAYAKTRRNPKQSRLANIASIHPASFSVNF